MFALAVGFSGHHQQTDMASFWFERNTAICLKATDSTQLEVVTFFSFSVFLSFFFSLFLFFSPFFFSSFFLFFSSFCFPLFVHLRHTSSRFSGTIWQDKGPWPPDRHGVATYSTSQKRPYVDQDQAGRRGFPDSGGMLDASSRPLAVSVVFAPCRQPTPADWMASPRMAAGWRRRSRAREQATTNVRTRPARSGDAGRWRGTVRSARPVSWEALCAA